MAKIPKSIYEKKLKGFIDNQIMVRFTHDCITYPVKNFTKLFGCTNRTEAQIKLEEVKYLMSQGKDPFSKSLETFAEIYEDKLDVNEANKKWSYNTVKNRRHFFNKYIKENKRIGKKRVEKITYNDIKSLLEPFGDKGSSKNTAIDILRPVFNEAFDKGVIHKNLMKSEAFKKERYATKLEIETRAHTHQVDIIRGLYESIPLYNKAIPRHIEMHKAFLYLLVMTAHRSGEIILLRKEDIDLENKKIFAPASATKTKGGYQYPLPDEVFDYVKNHKGGLLFTSPSSGSIDRVFKRLVDLAEIKLAENHKIAGHDTRRLFMSIMVEELNIDSNIADFCLEHKKNDIMVHYLHLKYDTKEETFKKYWNFLRGNTNEEDKKVVVNTEVNNKENTFDKLEKLVSMLEKGYITKEQFELERNRLY